MDLLNILTLESMTEKFIDVNKNTDDHNSRHNY